MNELQVLPLFTLLVWTLTSIVKISASRAWESKIFTSRHLFQLYYQWISFYYCLHIPGQATATTNFPCTYFPFNALGRGTTLSATNTSEGQKVIQKKILLVFQLFQYIGTKMKPTELAELPLCSLYRYQCLSVSWSAKKTLLSKVMHSTQGVPHALVTVVLEVCLYVF